MVLTPDGQVGRGGVCIDKTFDERALSLSCFGFGPWLKSTLLCTLSTVPVPQNYRRQGKVVAAASSGCQSIWSGLAYIGPKGY